MVNLEDGVILDRAVWHVGMVPSFGNENVTTQHHSLAAKIVRLKKPSSKELALKDRVQVSLWCVLSILIAKFVIKFNVEKENGESIYRH